VSEVEAPLAHVELAPLALKQLGAAEISNRIGDARPKHVSDQPEDDDPEQRQMALEHVEPGEQHRWFGARQPNHAGGCRQQQDSAEPEVADDVSRQRDERVSDGRDFEKHGGKRSVRGSISMRTRIGLGADMAIPLFDTKTPLAPLNEEIRARVEHVLERGSYILGPEVQAFEREFASYLGVRHVVGVANGTDAITIALRAIGISPGDEVVVPAFTFYATAEAVVTAGCKPVFCDVDLQTRNVTLDTVRAALTPRTRAVVAVDLFGCPAPLPELESLGLPILEDAAQAAGASLAGRRAGAFGNIATFSFYPSKNLGCFGDGGAIATDDDETAELATALRFHGSRDKRQFQYVGYNSRLDELQAAILRVLLPELDGWCAGRRAAAAAYIEAGLEDHVELPEVPAEAEPAWHLYVVTSPCAERLLERLRARDIQARSYYRTPLHRQPGMAAFQPDRSLPNTEELAGTNLALPMSPTLTRAHAEAVVAALADS
jgi:dTDP-4-amino-4,6-dideoxygalactose transaminase